MKMAEQAIKSPYATIDNIFQQHYLRHGNNFDMDAVFLDVKQVYDSLSANQAQSIPVLNKGHSHNAIVRFHGIVGDIFDTEFFDGLLATRDRVTNATKMCLSAYTDGLGSIDGMEVLDEQAYIKTLERYVVFLIMNL